MLGGSHKWFSSSRTHQRKHINEMELRALTDLSRKDNSKNGTHTRRWTFGLRAKAFLALFKSQLRKCLGLRATGWKFGALNFAVCATIVFLLNLVITIYGPVLHESNAGILLEGDCRRVQRLNTGAHVLINVFSTVLLSGSNYCMQCLSAPTRSEIDKAHIRNRWLDIGVPSIRNLRHIRRSN